MSLIAGSWKPCERVATAAPVHISSRFMNTWYIFTDGACETDESGAKVGGVGGVLISACGKHLQHFGMTVPDNWMSFFMRHSKHPIHEIEILPVLISFHVWRAVIANAQVMHYTDNDSCRFALMKGVGETPVAKCLVAAIMEREYQLETKSWYGRVPSHSNPSDDPSRGSFSALTALGSVRVVEIPWGELLAALPSLKGERPG